MADAKVMVEDPGAFEDLCHIIDSEMGICRELVPNESESLDQQVRIPGSGINWIRDSMSNLPGESMPLSLYKPPQPLLHSGLDQNRNLHNASSEKASQIYFGNKPTTMDPSALDAIQKILANKAEVCSGGNAQLWKPSGSEARKLEEFIIKGKLEEEVKQAMHEENQRLLGIIEMQKHLQELNVPSDKFNHSSSDSPYESYSSLSDLDSDYQMDGMSPLRSPTSASPFINPDSSNFDTLQDLPEASKKCQHGLSKKKKKKKKTSYPVSKPRLYNFLRELLNDKANQKCITWVDKDKGIFKFLDSTRVACLWGERKNKKSMKYENFARSLRTYVQKGILAKPRNKLVYCFTEPSKEIIGSADMVAASERYI